MSAEFPDAIFAPRTIENRPGVTYDPNDTKTLYAEDLQNLANEIVAVENTLGLNPDGDFTSVSERLSDIDLNILAAVLSSKIKKSTRLMTAASGDVAYTGIGFKPSVIIAFANIDASVYRCFGLCDSSKASSALYAYSSSALADFNGLFAVSDGVNWAQNAIVKSFDDDGFTLTWTKIGSPSGSADLTFLCLK